MTQQRPKPEPHAKNANDRYAKWVERQLGPAIGEHGSLEAAITAAVASVDLSAIEADIAALEADVAVHETRLDADDTELADHETRIDALEADETANKTATYQGKGISLGTNISQTYYHTPIGYRSSSPTTTLADGQMLWGRAGTIKNLRFAVLIPNADTDTFDFTLNIAGSDTALTLTGLKTDNSTVHSNTSDAVAVAVGDKITFKQLNGGAAITGTSVNPAWAFDFEEP